jgi:cytochrome c556
MASEVRNSSGSHSPEPIYDLDVTIRTPVTACTCIGLLMLGIVTAGCSSPKPTAPPPPAAPASQLWGDIKPVVSVKELMHYMIDPASDDVFDAVSLESTAKGRVERMPRTDADWEKVKSGAVTMAEGIDLLKVQRPFVPAGEENDSAAGELSSAEIRAKIEKDPVLWNAKIEALRNVSLEIMDVVKKRDVQALSDAGGDLDEACETCHLEFWYPNQKELMPKIDQHLQQLYGPWNDTVSGKK